MGILNQIYKKYQLYKNKLYALGLFLYTSSVLLRSSAYQYSNNADLLNLIFSSLSYLSYLIMLVIFLINILENMKNIYKRPNLYIFILFIAFLIYITFKTDTKAIFYGFLVVGI